MSGYWAFAVLAVCLAGLAFMFGPSWCPSASEHIQDAPICAGKP